MRVPFGEEHPAGAQGGVVDAQMFLQKLAAAIDRFEARKRPWAAAIVAPQGPARIVLHSEDAV